MKSMALCLAVVMGLAGNSACEEKKMDYSKIKLPERGLCAHRGAMDTHPENTLAAFREAIRTGAHMIELDVYLTRDKQLVVIHDNSVNRTTDGEGKVADLTLEEIKRLDAGSWKSDKFAGERIPTLREALAVMPLNVWLNVHLKGNRELGAEVAKVVVEMNRQHQAFLACGPEAAEGAQEVEPDIMICSMGKRDVPVDYVNKSISMKASFAQLVGPIQPEIREWAKSLRANGIRVNYFGTTKADEVRTLFEMGVDFPLVNNITELMPIAAELGFPPVKPMLPGQSVSQLIEPQIVTDPNREDYIKITPGGRYFVHSDGEFFTPLGYNHNPDWTDFHANAQAHPAYDPERAERFFKRLRDSGVNVIRMMIEVPGAKHFIENPIGTFNPDQVAWIDNIFTLARKYDIRLWVTPWDTFWMNHKWDINTYNSVNGGPVENKADFIAKREVIEAQKKRVQFMIDRWGNTGTIFAWELLNEADYWWGASPEQTIAWATEMRDFVREYEKTRWGRNHLICISTGHPIPQGGWGDLAYRLDGMDFASTHLYLDAANAPEEPIGPAKAIRKGVKFALKEIKDNRPYIDGENGPINKWIADQELDAEVFHHMSWSHLTSGGAGSSFRWPYRHPHHLSDGMFRVLKRMKSFTDSVPWEKLTGPLTDIQISEPEGWVACSMATKESALVWVASPNERVERIDIVWKDAQKTVRYRCFDTRTGKWFAHRTVQPQDGRISITVLGKRDSVAVVLE